MVLIRIIPRGPASRPSLTGQASAATPASGAQTDPMPPELNQQNASELQSTRRAAGFSALQAIRKHRPDFFAGTGAIVSPDYPQRAAKTVPQPHQGGHEPFRFLRIIAEGFPTRAQFGSRGKCLPSADWQSRHS